MHNMHIFNIILLFCAIVRASVLTMHTLLIVSKRRSPITQNSSTLTERQ